MRIRKLLISLCFILLLPFSSLPLFSQSQIACNGDTLQTSINIDYDIKNYQNIYISKGDTVYLRFLSDTIGYLESNTITMLNPGNYIYIYQQRYIVKQFKVRYLTDYETKLKNYAYLCDTCTLTLGVPNYFQSYIWSTGDTNNLIQVHTPGRYWIQFESKCDVSYSDTLELKSNYSPDMFYCGINDRDSVTYTNYEPDINLFHYRNTLEYELDLDKNGSSDYIIELYCFSLIAYRNKHIKIKPLNGNKVAIADTIRYKNVKPLLVYEMVNENLFWFDKETILYADEIHSPDYYSYYTIGGYLFGRGKGYKTKDFYMGFKLNSGLYAWGYFSLRKSVEEPLLDFTIYEYAINTKLPNNISTRQIQAIQVYPNPSSDIIYVEHSFNDICELEILDVYGKTIHRQNLIKGRQTININNLAAGIYFVRIYNNKQFYMKKIIKL